MLERLYAATAKEIGEMVNDLLSTPNFHLQQRGAVQEAAQRLLTQKSKGAGFADLLMAQIARAASCTSIVSLDRGAVRTARMTLLS